MNKLFRIRKISFVKITSILLVTGLLFLASNRSQADDTSGGCGLGWAVTKKISLLATTTRATTHAFLPPTFGMTSGTSGCASHSLAKKDLPAANFALANYESLRLEMAQGHGEYLTAFAKTLGCAPSANAVFGETAKTHFQELMQKSPSGLELFENSKSLIKGNPALSAQCAQG